MSQMDESNGCVKWMSQMDVSDVTLSECVEVEFDNALTTDKEAVYIYIVLSDSS